MLGTFPAIFLILFSLSEDDVTCGKALICLHPLNDEFAMYTISLSSGMASLSYREDGWVNVLCINNETINHTAPAKAFYPAAAASPPTYISPDDEHAFEGLWR
jgi:hypothetical protein